MEQVAHRDVEWGSLARSRGPHLPAREGGARASSALCYHPCRPSPTRRTHHDRPRPQDHSMARRLLMLMGETDNGLEA
eukprot:14522127-Alexandrium_andersonii.AAC.1